MPIGEKISDFCLIVDDLHRAIAFYESKIGFVLRRHAPGFADFHTYGVTLALWEWKHIVAHVGIENPAAERGAYKTMGAMNVESRQRVEDLYAELSGRGVEFVKAPKWYAWNAYACYFKDPDMNLWEIYAWDEGGHKGHFFEGQSPEAAA